VGLQQGAKEVSQGGGRKSITRSAVGKLAGRERETQIKTLRGSSLGAASLKGALKGWEGAKKGTSLQKRSFMESSMPRGEGASRREGLLAGV